MEFQGASFQNLGSWLLRLARLDLSVFDDVKDDASATLPAITVMVAASFLAGLGSWLWWVIEPPKDGTEVFLKSTIFGSIFQAALWFVWVYVAAMVLTRGYKAAADMNGMIRTMGLAFAPMAISLLVAVSVLSIPFAVIAVGATVLLSYVAIQAVTDASPQQVMLANLAGFAVFAIAMGILANVGQSSYSIFGGGLAPGIFFFNLNF
jgi:hypothetical protein